MFSKPQPVSRSTSRRSVMTQSNQMEPQFGENAGNKEWGSCFNRYCRSAKHGLRDPEA